MVEGLSGEVYDLVSYPIVTCDDETSISADERVAHQKVHNNFYYYVTNENWKIYFSLLFLSDTTSIIVVVFLCRMLLYICHKT